MLRSRTPPRPMVTTPFYPSRCPLGRTRAGSRPRPCRCPRARDRSRGWGRASLPSSRRVSPRSTCRLPCPRRAARPSPVWGSLTVRDRGRGWRGSAGMSGCRSLLGRRIGGCPGTMIGRIGTRSRTGSFSTGGRSWCRSARWMPTSVAARRFRRAWTWMVRRSCSRRRCRSGRRGGSSSGPGWKGAFCASSGRPII